MRSAEQSVIGSIILDGNKYLREAILTLTANDFEDMFCKAVFEEATEIDSEGKEINAITLEEKLGTDWREQGLEAAEMVQRISEKDFAEYVRVVKENSQKRQAYRFLYELTFTSPSENSIEYCQEQLSKALSVLNNNSMNKSINAKESFLKFVETKDEPKKYFKSGFPRLDKVLKIGKGDFIIVGGRPSSGKTALTLQMMLNMAKRHKVVYFSLETSPEKLTERAISNYTATPLADIKDGERLKKSGSWEKITPFYDTFAKLNFNLVPAAGWTVSQIKSKAVQENAEIVIIDYLGLIKSNAHNLYEKTTEISNDLHIMAQQTEIATVALAQLNRGGKNEPDMTSLRDSGAIEQDADAIILLTRPEKDSNNSLRDLFIVKNKDGESNIKIFLEFKGYIQRFSELDENGQPASSFSPPPKHNTF